MNKETMFNENVKLVWKVVHSMELYETKDMEIEDYFQIGAMGLLQAIDNYDASTGHQFSTYAVHCIANEIKRYFKDQNKLRLKVNSVATSYNEKKNIGSLGDSSEVEIIDTVVDLSSMEPYNDVTRTTLHEAIKVLTEDEYAFFQTHYLEAKLTEDITSEREYTIEKLGLNGVGEFKSIDRKVRIKIAKAFGVNYDPCRRATGGIVENLLKQLLTYYIGQYIIDTEVTIMIAIDMMQDGMTLRLSEDYTSSFDKLVYDIIDCSGGIVLQRLGDAVLFTVTVKEFDRIYAISKTEYEQLKTNKRTQLRAFTRKEYNEFLEIISQQ